MDNLSAVYIVNNVTRVIPKMRGSKTLINFFQLTSKNLRNILYFAKGEEQVKTVHFVSYYIQLDLT